jgi:3-hydroxy acid dehydrogenase/malonic semialdehyde reductase
MPPPKTLPILSTMSNQQPLLGKKALITGASAGIGLATAQCLDASGASTILLARRPELLQAHAKELKNEAQCVQVDVRDADAVSRQLEGCAPDILVLNAGLARGTSPAFENTAQEVDDMVDTNIKGYLNVLRSVLPAMKARGTGDVVLLGSVAGRQTYPGGGVYCMTKYAVRSLYESLRVDCFGSGLRFTTIDPGMVETDFSLVRFDGDEARAKAVYAGVNPLYPADIADAIQYVVSRPPNVNIGEMVLWSTDQASTTMLHRRPADS